MHGGPFKVCIGDALRVLWGSFGLHGKGPKSFTCRAFHWCKKKEHEILEVYSRASLNFILTGTILILTFFFYTHFQENSRVFMKVLS